MAGRPPINDYDDIDNMQLKINSYFNECSEKEDPLTFAGFSYALGYSSRTAVYELAKGDKPISEPIKKALLYIEADYEKNLRKQACTGAIFALKNRGWTDNQHIEHSGSVKIIDDIK